MYFSRLSCFMFSIWWSKFKKILFSCLKMSLLDYTISLSISFFLLIILILIDIIITHLMLHLTYKVCLMLSS